MLKALLACLLASLVASPTFTDNTVRVGMTRKQVEAILGEPSGHAIHMFGQNYAGSIYSSYWYPGLGINFRNDVVTTVDYHK